MLDKEGRAFIAGVIVGWMTLSIIVVFLRSL